MSRLRDIALARGDDVLRRAPGIWPGKRLRPTNVSEALGWWSPVAIAWAIDQGLIDGWPLELTKRGWRWLRSRNPREELPL